MQGFADPKVGAICGHADVANVDESWLTRMQVGALLRRVPRREGGRVSLRLRHLLLGLLLRLPPRGDRAAPGAWERQTFFGSPATFGDDRALTNRVLRDWRVLYASDAISHTAVPATLRQFLRQQLRWKRAWTRESLILRSFIWRRHPLAALQSYAGILISLVAPIVALRALVWRPLTGERGLPSSTRSGST